MTRRIPYPFSSIEWNENINAQFPPWPKSDPREGNRRKHDRRRGDRRQRSPNEQQRPEIKYPATLLTQEERELIEFLNRDEEMPDDLP